MEVIRVGDRVVKIEGGRMIRGVVKKVLLEDPAQLLVEFEDGTYGKPRADEIALEPKAQTAAEQKAEEPKVEESRESEEEILFSKTITISLGEFRNIAVRTIAERTRDNFMLGLVMTKIISEISAALFLTEGEDD